MKKAYLIFVLASVIAFAGWALSGEPRFAGGNIFPGNITVTDEIILQDGTDTHNIKAVRETGLGGRLTIGLDETARVMTLCDAGDIDSDLGLAIQTHPTLAILRAGGTNPAYYGPTTLIVAGNYEIKGSALTLNATSTTPSAGYGTVNIASDADISQNNFVVIKGSSATKQLTDANGEQSWLQLIPLINQSGTAAYNALKVNVTETTIGDGSTGDGNCLVNLQVASTTKYKIDNLGNPYLVGATETVTTEGNITDPLPSSMLLISGDNDEDNDAIDLQDGESAGQIVHLIASANVDATDTITINMADTTCTNCPAIVMDKVGENASLIWTGTTWVVTGLQTSL